MSSQHLHRVGLLSIIGLTAVAAVAQGLNRRGNDEGPPRDFVVGPGGPGGPGGPRMMGGPMGREMKVVDRFDKDSDGKLNKEERKAAREFVTQERANGGGGMRRFGRGGEGEQEPPKPGKRVSPSDVKSFGDTPLYDGNALRTFFLEFENADWEKELMDFRNTDVEVPARLTVDGKRYEDVGVHFRGMSSLMGVPEGRKHSLNLTLDLVKKGQNLLGYRTLNLLNGHEDPSYIRPILFYDIAREYIPAPKGNLARVVINGEDWGIYANVQQFNKEFLQENFGTKKGARWKVRGSPGGRGSLAYLGDDPEAYKQIYTIKTKDDPKVWRAFIQMCKVLNQTPPDQLEAALSPLLDIDGALKFLALDNALINNDGYWIRTSDYSIYRDEKGKFHVIPQDANETFARPGGPGFGPGGPGGPGGGMRFSPTAMLVPMFFEDGDKNEDRKLTVDEFHSLAGAWFSKLDADSRGKLTSEEFTEELSKVLPQPEGFQRPPGARFGPARFMGPGLFAASDLNHDGELTAAELNSAFAKWAGEWDKDQNKAVDEEEVRNGLASLIPQGNFPGGPGGGGRFAGGPNPGPGGPGGPGPQMRAFGGRNMPRVEGVKLDPLVAANDDSKPLASKLLAVPALRERYLGYVRDIAEKHLDWKKLGPAAERYQNLIRDVVRDETRGLDTFEAFAKSLTEDPEGRGGFGRISISLKNFADQRREYLLNYKETGPQK